MSWYDRKGPNDDIVVSTRIRLARNLRGIPFPAKMNKEQFEKVNNIVKEAVLNSSAPIAKGLKFIKMEDIPANERACMVERHIISPAFAENYQNRAIIISSDESISIMLGEEDHIRIQIILPGLQLEKAYEIASLVDDMLCEKADIAFHKELGFLTECPTNLGTGLRASVMMHLPLSSESGNFKSFIDSASKIGYTVRGLYGEGTKATAYLYQISNQITLGISEKSVIENLKVIAENLIKNEKELQSKIDKTKLEDISMRALGTLKYARIISSSEMMQLLSNLSVGISAGVIKKDIKPFALFIEGQPHTLMKKYGEMTAGDRDIKRAGVLRDVLK